MCYVQNTCPHSSPTIWTSDKTQGRSPITAFATEAEAKTRICSFRRYRNAHLSGVRVGDRFTLLQKAHEQTQLLTQRASRNQRCASEQIMAMKEVSAPSFLNLYIDFFFYTHLKNMHF